MLSEVVFVAVLLFVYSIASIGFAYIVGHSVISQGLREWAYGPVTPGLNPINSTRRLLVTLVECPACLGFWTGLGTGFLIGASFFGALVFALFTSGSNLVLGKLTRLME